MGDERLAARTRQQSQDRDVVGIHRDPAAGATGGIEVEPAELALAAVVHHQVSAAQVGAVGGINRDHQPVRASLVAEDGAGEAPVAAVEGVRLELRAVGLLERLARVVGGPSSPPELTATTAKYQIPEVREEN